MGSNVLKTYQQLIRDLSELQLFQHQRQDLVFKNVNELDVFRILLPDGTVSFELLTAGRMQYVNKLLFPLDDGASVPMKRLAFANLSKEIRQHIFKIISECLTIFVSLLEQVNVNGATGVKILQQQNFSEDLCEVYTAIRSTLQSTESPAAPSDPPINAADSDILSNVMSSPALKDQVNKIFSFDELSKIHEGSAALQAASTDITNPLSMLSDPKVQAYFQSVSEMWNTKTPEQREEFMKVLQNDPSIMSMMGNQDPSNLLLRETEQMTRPIIDDSDPLALSDEQFERLCQENGIKVPTPNEN